MNRDTRRRLVYALLGIIGLGGGWLAAELLSGAPVAPGLVCPVRTDARLADGATLWVRGSGSLQRVEGRWDDDAVRFADAPPAGEGELVVPGHVPVDVRWEDHRCDPVALRPAAVIVGSVSQVGPDEEVVVIGCGTQAEVGPDGSFYLEVPDAPCTLRAVRSEGVLAAEGGEVPVRPTLGHDTVVDLLLPPPVGGIGVRFSVDDAGIVVEDLFADGAAEEAGLAPGDRIVSVGGVPTAGMGRAEFARQAVGPVGSTVEVEIEAEDGRHTVTLERRPLQ